MKIQGQQKVVLYIVFGFFAILIVFAIIIRSNYGGNDKFDVPGSTSNSKDLRNRINVYYETHKDDVKDVKTSTMDDIYTALITTEQKTVKKNNVPVYKAYYYNTSTDKELGRKEVLEKLGYTEEYIKDKILDHFKKFYDQEAEQGYVDKNECNLEECYLSFYRNVNDLDEYVLNIEDEKLYVYISFDTNSLVGDKEFFDKLDYNYYKIEID